jgi:hypothetical protein
MTVGALIKRLQQMPPRTPVVVDVKSFKQIIPEWNLIHVKDAEFDIIERSDDDGGTSFKKNGTARTMRVCTIYGDHDWMNDVSEVAGIAVGLSDHRPD